MVGKIILRSFPPKHANENKPDTRTRKPTGIQSEFSEALNSTAVFDHRFRSLRPARPCGRHRNSELRRRRISARCGPIVCARAAGRCLIRVCPGSARLPPAAAHACSAGRDIRHARRRGVLQSENCCFIIVETLDDFIAVWSIPTGDDSYSSVENGLVAGIRCHVALYGHICVTVTFVSSVAREITRFQDFNRAVAWL